jgi:hypothetical protein
VQGIQETQDLRWEKNKLIDNGNRRLTERKTDRKKKFELSDEEERYMKTKLLNGR